MALSLCAASCCTSCLAGSSGFATMGCWPVAAKQSNCQQPGRLCRCLQPARRRWSRPRLSWQGGQDRCVAVSALRARPIAGDGSPGGSAAFACARQSVQNSTAESGAAVTARHSATQISSLSDRFKPARGGAVPCGHIDKPESPAGMSHIHWTVRFVRNRPCQATRAPNPPP